MSVIFQTDRCVKRAKNVNVTILVYLRTDKDFPIIFCNFATIDRDKLVSTDRRNVSFSAGQ